MHTRRGTRCILHHVIIYSRSLPGFFYQSPSPGRKWMRKVHSAPNVNICCSCSQSVSAWRRKRNISRGHWKERGRARFLLLLTESLLLSAPGRSSSIGSFGCKKGNDLCCVICIKARGSDKAAFLFSREKTWTDQEWDSIARKKS